MYEIKRMDFVVFVFWVTNAFDTWLAMYVERAADNEMCIVSGW